jgi:hypothetical protein
MAITERDLLDEIANIITHNNLHGTAYTSKERGKRFFEPLALPEKLASYIRDSRKESVASVAKMFDMSAQSLKRIIDREQPSENMLFRLRNSLEYAIQHPGISVMRDEPDVYFGDWRNTNSNAVQNAISEVSARLVFLRRTIESSNSIKAADSPVDPIQIAQLIAMLEATLAALKAPFVDTDQTGGFLNYLKKLGKRLAKDKTESAISDAIDSAVDAGTDLLIELQNAAGTSDIGGIIT